MSNRPIIIVSNGCSISTYVITMLLKFLKLHNINHNILQYEMYNPTKNKFYK